VNFAGNFAPDEQDHRSTGAPAGCIRKDTSGWNVPLVYTKQHLLGACENTPISPPQFCM
jgi:hypothetical protein